MVFWLPLPNSASSKFVAANENKPHNVRPDLDNLAKAVLDALFDNDSRIPQIYLRKQYTKSGGLTGLQFLMRTKSHRELVALFPSLSPSPFDMASIVS